MDDLVRTIESDECLSIRHGHLFMEDCDTVELANRYGTPVYVCSETQLRRNARRFVSAFAGQWPGPVNVLPSFKANIVLALRRILTDEGLGCDTFGSAELWAALRCGVSPELISVNGTGKSPELITTAVESGCRITLDSTREFDLAAAAARKIGCPARIRFRVRPYLESLDTSSDFSVEGTPIRDLMRLYKPGIPMEDLVPLGVQALAMDEVDVTGLHVHFARHTRSLDAWEVMVRAFAEIAETLSKAWGGWKPREIDIGGGFPTPRDPTGRTIARLASVTGTAPPVEEFAEMITTTLQDVFRGSRIQPQETTLEVEPGRSLYADAGIHLASVVNVKTESEPEPIRWVEVDTTEMFLLDGQLEHNAWISMIANRADARSSETVELVGISCGFDTISSGVMVPEATGPGDVVAFLDTGAYQEVCASNFNALPRPGTVLVRGDHAEMVKRPETISDVFDRDLPRDS